MTPSLATSRGASLERPIRPIQAGPDIVRRIKIAESGQSDGNSSEVTISAGASDRAIDS